MTSQETFQVARDRRTAVLCSAVVAGEAGPEAVVIVPWGEVRSANGDFVVDDEAGRLVLAAFTEHGTDLPIDYEHQTLGGAFAAPDGRAPAAGWIKRLEVRPGVGLVAHIEWTEPARELLRTKQYRYVSPVAVVRKDDRRMAALHSVALTNKPAIVGMAPIVNKAKTGGDAGPTLTGEDAGATLTGGDAGATALELLRGRLALPEEAEAGEVLLAASARLADLERQSLERRAEERVRAALTGGRLTEAQRGWAERLVLRDEGLFEEWLRTAPVVVRCGATAPPHHDGGESKRRGAEARARAEYRAQPLLAALTSEEAYVAEALRGA